MQNSDLDDSSLFPGVAVQYHLTQQAQDVESKDLPSVHHLRRWTNVKSA